MRSLHINIQLWVIFVNILSTEASWLKSIFSFGQKLLDDLIPPGMPGLAGSEQPQMTKLRSGTSKGGSWGPLKCTTADFASPFAIDILMSLNHFSSPCYNMYELPWPLHNPSFDKIPFHDNCRAIAYHDTATIAICSTKHHGDPFNHFSLIGCDRLIDMTIQISSECMGTQNRASGYIDWTDDDAAMKEYNETGRLVVFKPDRVRQDKGPILFGHGGLLYSTRPTHEEIFEYWRYCKSSTVRKCGIVDLLDWHNWFD